jgi:hypothetical protein
VLRHLPTRVVDIGDNLKLALESAERGTARTVRLGKHFVLPNALRAAASSPLGRRRHGTVPPAVWYFTAALTLLLALLPKRG